MKKEQWISLLLAIFILLIGSFLYILFRPTTLIMFDWFETLHLTQIVMNMRNSVQGMDQNFPRWVVYSMPYAAWVVSYLFFMSAIWWNSTSKIRYFWLWSAPVVAVLTEVAQLLRAVPGFESLIIKTFGFQVGDFDIIDLLALIIGIILYQVIIFILKKKGVNHEK